MFCAFVDLQSFLPALQHKAENKKGNPQGSEVRKRFTVRNPSLNRYSDGKQEGYFGIDNA
jgi:hypothetical protein